ncbi:MAG: response regulator transcription factor [Gemmatimonadetes bacterium]|nr:response regulator transcription factor [Gemmatimonadota bacterium]MBI3568535.1 response regulator transcription factor [Gemmatimonadota bacterium]
MPHAGCILVIDDEPHLRRAIRNALREVADRVVEAGTGAEGIDLAAAEQPDLVVLDLGLPDVNGLDVCREIRRWATMPIVVLSARHGEHDKVQLLEGGADDYVTKPFSTVELLARVKAQLRRARAQRAIPADTPYVVGPLSMDLVRRVLLRDGTAVHLTPIEWNILRALVLASGRTLTHQQLFDAVWGRAYGNAQQYLRVHITNLRRKIEPEPSAPRYIVTEPGVGYRFEGAA